MRFIKTSFPFLVTMLACMVVSGSPMRSSVGHRHIAMSDGGGEVSCSAADYVQEGLVFLLDGIENSGWDEHDDEAATWKDLIGNHDAVLSTAAINNGRFLWKDNGLWHIGPNSDVIMSCSLVDLIGSSTSFSISYTVSFEEVNTTLPRFSPIGNSMGAFGFYNTRNNFFVSMPWATGYGQIDVQLQDNTIEATITCDGTHVNGYVNGVLFSSAMCGNYSSFLSRKLYMFYVPGFNPTVDNSWKCIIHRVLIYDRSINGEEEYRNYLVDRKRFGL